MLFQELKHSPVKGILCFSLNRTEGFVVFKSAFNYYQRAFNYYILRGVR